jgi:hypothetical protein
VHATSGANYKSDIKPGDKPTYVHSQSNHPPRIIKNIPLSIIKRLAKISANKAASPLYQAELTKSGYQHTLEFDQTASTNRRRTRTRKVIYFNPPYSINVKTNIGETFLRLIDYHFPPESPLHPLIIQIAKHNFNILNQEKLDPPPTCNCQDKPKCPLPGPRQVHHEEPCLQGHGRCHRNQHRGKVCLPYCQHLQATVWWTQAEF